MKIGFIGLGKMGMAMARNLAAAGHELTVYNRTRAKAEDLASKTKARIADSAADAANGRDAVFTMLADDRAVLQVLPEIEAALGETKSIHIGSSTISVALATEIARRHAEKGQRYVAAPVFGRPDAAEQKRLLVAVAGEPSALDEAAQLFEAIGRKTLHVGTEPHKANAIKLCGNFLIASMLESFSEAFAALRKANIDPHEFLDVILEVFNSPVYTNYGRQMADRKWETPGAGFGLALGLKDVRLVAEFADSVAAPMPVASVIKGHLLSAVANGQSELDWTSLALVLERAAGVSH